ncbi:MAG: protein kinase [Planctomycetota bacterium]|nr:protein kinase [Planctomycetota bacterium]
MFPRAVAEGIHLALEAHRRGLLDEAALDLVLRYYDAEGARDPAPAEDVLVRLGGVDPASVGALLTEAGLAPAAPARADLPFVSPRLTLTERLGAGAMGAVYRAHDRVLGRDVAVKVVHPERLAGSEATRLLARFAREAKAMARVRHPAVVPLHDAGLDPAGRPYLVMEYVAGESLARVLAPGVADWREVVAWGRTLAEALQACHDVGVIHCDVKPGNILIDDRRRPHLTDFGVALDAASQTRLTADRAGMVGTLAYMAPEQITGQGADGRADVYALGATLFEALTGAPPFDGPAVVLMRRALEGEAPPLRRLRPDLPEDLDTVVATCLARSPTERYATAQALALDLARVLADEPVVARRIGRVGRLQRLARRHRRAVALTATAGLVATLTASGLALYGRSLRHAAQAAEIDAALRGADLAPAEEALARIVAAPESADLMERARAARQEVQRRRYLGTARAALARYQSLLAEVDRHAADALDFDARIEPSTPFSTSPEKKARAAVRRALEVARRGAETARLDCERALAQAALDAPAPEVEALRAHLLLTEARHLEERDPSAAEALFALAETADRAGGGQVAANLRPAVLEVMTSPPAQVLVRRYRFDPECGFMRLTDPTHPLGATPFVAELPAGEYLVEVHAEGYLPGRVPILLRRGGRRRLDLSLVQGPPLGPMRHLVRWIPGGVAHWNLDFAASAVVPDRLLRTTEVSVGEWRSFMRANGDSIHLLPAWDALARRSLSPGNGRIPVSAVTRDTARAFLSWLNEEFARIRMDHEARLPTLPEYHRAVRGELRWTYPWGREFDESFCLCADSNRDPTGLSWSDFVADESPFGVLALAGSVGEMTNDDHPLHKQAFVLTGGSFASSSAVLRTAVLHQTAAPFDFRSVTTGFRYVLVPRSAPLPDAPNDVPRSAALQQAALDEANRGDLARAYQLATAAIDAAPLEARAWNNRGGIRLLLEDTWGAWWDFTRVLDLAPTDVGARLNRAQALAGERAYTEALADLNKAIELDPKQTFGWGERGRLRLLLGDASGAVEDTTEALRLAPRDPLAARWRGTLEQARRALGR